MSERRTENIMPPLLCGPYSDENIELGGFESIQPARSHTIQSSHDTISTIHASRRRSRLSTLDDDEEPVETGLNVALVSNESESVERLLLKILRVLQYSKVAALAISPSTQFNTRRILGHGTSFSVEQSFIPIKSTTYYEAYRQLDLESPDTKRHFIDHTGTKWETTTEVAYKRLSIKKSELDQKFDRRRLDDTLVELRVLCHESLQTHPNIVRLLGVAWLKDENLDVRTEGYEQSIYSGPQYWPVAVTEKAEYGSLHDFLASDQFKASRTSLKAKVKLCLDVLFGLLAVHSCDVVHGDLKPGNVLVFRNHTSTAENWTAKLSDFGSSLLDLETTTADGRLHDEYRGTRYYHPPERRISGSSRLHKHSIQAADMWCWGMLVWKVMVNGASNEQDDFLDANGQPIDDATMTRLQRDNTLSQVAMRAVSKFFSRDHPDAADERLSTWILEVLKLVLDKDPEKRPRAQDIIASMKSSLGSQWAYFSRSGTDFDYQPVKDLDKLPFFDLFYHYYHIFGFRSLPPKVFAELERITKLKSRHNNDTMILEANLQLALCYGVGFGTEKDIQMATNYLFVAARGGLAKAMEISLRLPQALSGHSTFTDEVRMWLRKAALNGSIIAAEDLQFVDASAFTSTRSEAISISRRLLEGSLGAWFDQYTKASSRLTNSDSGILTGKDILEELIAEADSNPSGSKGVMNDNNFRHSCREIILKANGHRESPLLAAIRSGDFELARFLIKAKVDITYRGPSGETLLHWLSTSPLREATDIARLILAAGVDMHQPTHRIWRVSSESHFPSEIEAGSTAIEIAIDYDHLDMVKFLLYWETEHLQGTISTSEGLFSRAAQAQSYLTLQYFCENHSSEVNEFDQRKFSPFYYACRPDALQRLLRYRPQSHEYPVSVENKAKAVVAMLLRAGSNMAVRSDDLFGPFHLLASVEDPEMLQLALGGNNMEQWLNASTNFYDKATPLKEAVIKGHIDSMRILLEKGASPKNIDASGGHVLHVCALAPGDVAVEQATFILDRFPSAINARSGFLQVKALYSASWYGNGQLIRFLLDFGSDPRKVSHYITALGAAINSRSITAVKVLCEEYRRRRWPLLAALYAPDRRPKRFTYFHTGTYVSAISFLLTPGAFSPVESRLGHPKTTGSYDHPFSHTSEIILDILLAANDKPRLPWTVRFPLLSTPARCYPSGLNEAVRLGNSKLIDKIYSLQGKNHTIEFNTLIAIALDQLALKQNHIATVDERKKVLKHMRDLEEATYDCEQRDRRTHKGNFLTRCYWSMKYSLYDAPKHRLFIRIWDGVQEDTLGGLNDGVFNRWLVNLYELDWPLIFSVWWFIVFMMWGVFLVPMITCLGVYSMDGRSGWSKGNTVNLAVVAIVTILIPLWIKILRFITVHAANSAPSPLGKAHRIPLLQTLVVLVFTAISVFDIFLLYGGNSKFAPSDAWLNTPDENGVYPYSPQVLKLGFRFANGLIAWIVITQMTIQVYCFVLSASRLYHTYRPVRGTIPLSDAQQTALVANSKIIF